MSYSLTGRGIVLWKIEKYCAKDSMSTKISFTYYMKWSRVMLSVTSSFKEFALVYKYLFFSIQQYHFLVKGQLYQNLRTQPSPHTPWFLRTWFMKFLTVWKPSICARVISFSQEGQNLLKSSKQSSSIPCSALKTYNKVFQN